jgi:1,4-alpha-glucan branching enzyme
VTVGLTPVLADQLEAMRGPAGERFLAYLREVKTHVHSDAAASHDAAGERGPAAELRRAAGDYARAVDAFLAHGGDLLGALASAGAALMTSAATHALLPLLASDAGRRLQVEAGVAAHRRRFGDWSGGFWLPECAYAPELEHDLSRAGVRAFCVEQTAALGLGSLDVLEPVATAAGPVAVPVDWATVGLVWEPAGYPSGTDYRDTHRRSHHDLTPWANHGGTYDPEAALALARAHARDFVVRVVERLDAYRAARGRPGLVCCALDTELLGHFWYEGPAWLGGVLEEAAAQGLTLRALPAALEHVEHVARPLAAASWGRGGDLSTWDSPATAEIVFGARRAELRVTAAARLGPSPALARAARELLAAQSSDWAFMTSRRTASDYPLRRARGHLAGVDEALTALPDSPAVPEPALRMLAPHLDLGPLLLP